MVNWNCWLYSPHVSRRSLQATGDANKALYRPRYLPDKHHITDPGSNRQQTKTVSVDHENIRSGRSFAFKSGRQTCLQKSEVRLYLILQLVVLTVVLGFLHCYNVYSFYDGTLWGCVVMISENFSFLLNTLVTIQFVNAVLMLKKRYASINRLLKDAEYRNMWYGVEVTEVVVVGNDIDARFPENRKKKLVHTLRVIYCQLHVAATLIMSNYGFPVFMVTFWIFTTIVFVLYYGLFSLQEVISYPAAAEQHEVILSLCWCMFCITLTCHMTTQEANMSVILVEKLLLCHDLRDDTVNELRDFSSQLGNMRIEFSPCGFFTLNLSFLYAITGVMCSHIIILASLN